MVQNAYALLVITLTLGSDPLMLESPISASTRPLLVVNNKDDEVLKIPRMLALDVTMTPWSACTDYDN